MESRNQVEKNGAKPKSQTIRKKSINMKKQFILIVAIIAIMTFSCTDDFKNPKNLVGTTWRCSEFANVSARSAYNYMEVKFISETGFETWVNLRKNGETKFSEHYNYSIKGNKLTTIELSMGGTIEKDKMYLTIDSESEIETFYLTTSK